MAFFANTGPDANARLSQMLGQAMGQGVAKNFTPPEQLANERRLSKAFQNIPEGANLADIYKTAGPTLASTPGGMELLDRYSQAAQKTATAKSYQDLLNRRQSANTPTVPPVKKTDANESPEPTDRYRKPFQTKLSSFPEPATTLQPKQIPTPDQQEKMIDDALISQREQGLPPDLNSATQIVDDHVARIMDHNRNVRTEKGDIEQRRQNNAERGIQEAERQDLINPEFPEDSTTFRNAMLRNEGAPSFEDQFASAKLEYEDYLNHRDNLITSYTQPNIISNTYRKLLGTNKDKEQALEGIQPNLEYFKDHGLYNEARNILINHMDFGQQDAETALFPPSEAEKKDLSLFKHYPKQVTSPYDSPDKVRFLNETQMNEFTDDLGKYLKKNPLANLLALRGDLMDKNNLSWQEIDKAIIKLRRNGQFKPADPIQEHQYGLLHSSRQPGLYQIFQPFWKDTI